MGSMALGSLNVASRVGLPEPTVGASAPPKHEVFEALPSYDEATGPPPSYDSLFPDKSSSAETKELTASDTKGTVMSSGYTVTSRPISFESSCASTSFCFKDSAETELVDTRNLAIELHRLASIVLMARLYGAFYIYELVLIASQRLLDKWDMATQAAEKLGVPNLRFVAVAA